MDEHNYFDDAINDIRVVLKTINEKFGNNKYQYELVAESYDRYGEGGTYKKIFLAPNDYIALFCMRLHKAPTVANLAEEFDADDIQHYFKEYPTYKDFLSMASENWWGDGDDYIISVKNLSTNTVLYEGGDTPYDEVDDSYDFDESEEE